MSRTGNWIILAGSGFFFLGLCVIAAALGDTTGTNMFPLGALLFSLGTMSLGLGMFLKARDLQVKLATPTPSTDTGRRVRGGCDLCASETPSVQCRVHQLHLCGSCLADHHDPRSCAYVPSLQRLALKTVGRNMPARAHT